jgi:Uma2 family endonuclease
LVDIVINGPLGFVVQEKLKMSMVTLQDIKRAIEQLTTADRDALRRWLYISWGAGLESTEYRVAEPAVAYAPDPEHPYVSVEEYLEGELHSQVRHEYVEGHVYAMAGASDDHNRIAGNIFSFLHAALRGKPCEPFINDMKAKISSQRASTFYYPDVLVACDPTDKEKYYRERPVVVVEVLSPETRRTDEREKAIAYRLVSSVDLYLLVEQDRLRVTALHRADNDWRREVIEGRTAALKLECLGVEIPMERIYERTAVVRACQ